jgi:hypothetical protein
MSLTARSLGTVGTVWEHLPIPRKSAPHKEKQGRGNSGNSFTSPVCVCVREANHTRPLQPPLPMRGCERWKFFGVSRVAALKLFPLFPREKKIKWDKGLGREGYCSQAFPTVPTSCCINHQPGMGPGVPPYRYSQQAWQCGMFEPQGCASGWPGHLLTKAVTA